MKGAGGDTLEYVKELRHVLKDTIVMHVLCDIISSS